MLGWITLGAKLFPLIVGAVHAVESLAGAKKGKDKQDAAVAAVKAMLLATEGAAGQDLLDDDDVQDATRKLIDAYVAVQNVMAKKKAQQKQD